MGICWLSLNIDSAPGTRLSSIGKSYVFLNLLMSFIIATLVFLSYSYDSEVPAPCPSIF